VAVFVMTGDAPAAGLGLTSNCHDLILLLKQDKVAAFAMNLTDLPAPRTDALRVGNISARYAEHAGHGYSFALDQSSRYEHHIVVFTFLWDINDVTHQ
jgi:hypothetical protein